MSSTLRYWLVANLGLVVCALMILFGITDLLTTDHSPIPEILKGTVAKQNFAIVLKGYFWLFCLFIWIVFCFPTPRSIDSASRYLTVMGFGVICSVLVTIRVDGVPYLPAEEVALLRPLTWMFWSVVGVAHVVAVFVAVYIFRNFEEVVSRRMLWRNSNVSLFDEQLKYTIVRFMDTVCVLVFIVAVIIGLRWCNSIIDGASEFWGVPNPIVMKQIH